MNTLPFAAAFFLATAFCSPSAVAQGQMLELEVTFDFLTDTLTPTDSVLVQLGFDGGSVGIEIGSTLVQQLEIVGNQLFLSIEVEPPPTSDIVVPAYTPLNPVVDLGKFSPGNYQIHAEMFGYAGESNFVVVPEPSAVAMFSLAVFALAIAFSRAGKSSRY